MILIDTSVWIGHFRSNNPDVQKRLLGFEIVTHPFVIGELAVGALHPRSDVLRMMQGLPQLTKAHDPEVLAMVEARRLSGLGIGYTDAHLIASLLLSPDAVLWTFDRRFAVAASSCGIGLYPP